MTKAVPPAGNGNLFRTDPEVGRRSVDLRSVTPEVAETELRLRLEELKTDLERLEKAKGVTEATLRLEISV